MHTGSEGLSGAEWKDRYFTEALGFEDSVWEDGPCDGCAERGHFPCGWGVQASCRDLARVGQLWVNEGRWGDEELADRGFIIDAGEGTYPAALPPYGYTSWLRTEDPVDPSVAQFEGAGSQSVFVSKAHQAVIVSMGEGAPSSGPVWNNVREHIVSKEAAAPPL